MLCKYWEKGCERPNCRFEHPVGRGWFVKIEGCWYENKGICHFGEMCRHKSKREIEVTGTENATRKTEIQIENLQKQVQQLTKRLAELEQRNKESEQHQQHQQQQHEQHEQQQQQQQQKQQQQHDNGKDETKLEKQQQQQQKQKQQRQQQQKKCSDENDDATTKPNDDDNDDDDDEKQQQNIEKQQQKKQKQKQQQQEKCSDENDDATTKPNNDNDDNDDEKQQQRHERKTTERKKKTNTQQPEQKQQQRQQILKNWVSAGRLEFKMNFNGPCHLYLDTDSNEKYYYRTDTCGWYTTKTHELIAKNQWVDDSDVDSDANTDDTSEVSDMQNSNNSNTGQKECCSPRKTRSSHTLSTILEQKKTPKSGTRFLRNPQTNLTGHPDF